MSRSEDEKEIAQVDNVEIEPLSETELEGAAGGNSIGASACCVSMAASACCGGSTIER